MPAKSAACICTVASFLVHEKKGIEGSGTQSLWTLSDDGGFQVTSSAEKAFGFSHIQGVWKKTGAHDAKARGLDFNFRDTPVNGGVPPAQIARLDIEMRFGERCRIIERGFELRVFDLNEDPLASNTPADGLDIFSGRRITID